MGARERRRAEPAGRGRGDAAATQGTVHAAAPAGADRDAASGDGRQVMRAATLAGVLALGAVPSAPPAAPPAASSVVAPDTLMQQLSEWAARGKDELSLPRAPRPH